MSATIESVINEDVRKGLNNFFADREEEQIIAESNGLYEGGQCELAGQMGEDGEIVFTGEDLDKLRVRRDIWAQKLVESGARRESPVLRTAFSKLVGELAQKGKVHYTVIDRVLRIAFLNLSHVPEGKIEETIQWASENLMSLEEVVILSDHDFGRSFGEREVEAVFDREFFTTIRSAIVAEANRVLDAMKKGPVRMAARAKAGDQFAGRQVKRFTNKVSSMFAVDADVLREECKAWVTSEVSITLKAIKALGGLKAIDRKFMNAGEYLEKVGGWTPSMQNRIGLTMEGWVKMSGLPDIYSRLDVRTEVERATPAARAARKAAKRAYQANNAAKQKQPRQEYKFAKKGELMTVDQARFWLESQGFDISALDAIEAFTAPVRENKKDKAGKLYNDKGFGFKLAMANATEPKIDGLGNGLYEVIVPFVDKVGRNLVARFIAAFSDPWNNEEGNQAMPVSADLGDSKLIDKLLLA